MRRYRSPIGWFEVGDVWPLGTNLVINAQEMVRFIHDKLLEGQSR